MRLPPIAPALALVLPGLLAACAMTAPLPGNARIAGSMRVGNQAPPALRVCAMPVGGGASHCVDTVAGANQYRIDGLPAGRYHVLGWARPGADFRLLAHASTIRCIRAPCPPDTLIEVQVQAGQVVEGVDLSAPYTAVPAGWPVEP